MKKEELDAKYEDCYHYFADLHNSQPMPMKILGAVWDCITTIREATLYLHQYGELVPPKLRRVMNDRISNSKRQVIKYYNEIPRWNEQV